MRDDGTWSIWFEGPPDLSTSIEAYVALRMCRRRPRAARRSRTSSARAASRRRASSRSASSRCSASGRGSGWCRSRPSSSCCPPSAPFSIYNFACWARQTFVALALAQSLRPVRPADVDLSRDRRASRRDARAAPAERAAPQGAARRRAVDPRAAGGGRLVGRHPAAVGLGDHRARPRSATASRTTTLRNAVEGWQGFMVEDGDRLRPEACQSPVWDTGLAVLALRACGVPADHPQLVRGRRVPARRRRSRSRATGRSACPTSRPAAGRSSTRTTSIPTPTTPP